MPTLRAAQLLFSQGFGTRRQCAGIIDAGLLRVGGEPIKDADAALPTEGLVFEVEGRAWPYHAKALVMLHKPAGYECSLKPRHHPSVLGLLPPPLRTRGVQPVGRLDEDTTGLLLLTDDGGLIHRLTSPKHHVHKVYEVTAKHPVGDDALQRLRDGVVLDDDPAPVRAVAAERTGAHTLRMTLEEGRYHQVKRMLAAVGNRCERLHRSAFGPWVLPADLAPGQWRWLEVPAAGQSFAPSANARSR
jgi:16S rRNA pseudouridine516 synthase